MRSRKSKKSKLSNTHGIYMRIIDTPNLVAIVIPKNQPGAATFVELIVAINNKTLLPFPFIAYGGLIPEILAVDNPPIKLQEPRNRQLVYQRYNWTIIRSRDSIGISIKAKLSWQNNSLQFEFSTNPAYYWEPSIAPKKSWIFDALNPGKYELRFIYNSPEPEIFSSDLEIRQLAESAREISTDTLATPYIHFHLVESLESNLNAVEVNGIGFRTLVQQVLTVPNRESASGKSVRLAGIRISNKSEKPVIFSLCNNLFPQIMDGNGKIIKRGYYSNWVREPQKFDFILAMPGKHITFFPKGRLYWRDNDVLLLNIDDGMGGTYIFELTEIGTYKIQFTYSNNQEIVEVYDQEKREWNLIENIWTGMVVTKCVEFNLTSG